MKIVCLQIDLARQKENIEFVKNYADFAKANGYNTLLIYLENAVRTKSMPFFNVEETYSEKEMLEIVAYAESIGLDVIPAFENLPHLEKFFAYPELAELSECENADVDGRGLSGGGHGSCGCVSKPKFYEVFDAYIREVCALFHSQYVHVGLDETFDFAVCPRCQARMKAERKTKADLFYEHVMHTYELLKSMRKTMMMWDDFFQYLDIIDRLPRDIIFTNWNYYFISDEPSGHWTNRIKRDWFRYYDELGFRYLFCVYAHKASSTYNLDTFTDYAKKYNPIGAVATEWENSAKFYQGSYPFAAYAGRLWSGKVTEADKESVYTEMLGDRECAKLVLSLEHPAFYGGHSNVATYCEGNYFTRRMYVKSLAYAVEKLKVFSEHAKAEYKDVVTDIYDWCQLFLLDLQLQEMGAEIFDNYETKAKSTGYFAKKLDEMQARYDEIQANEKLLWAKYRTGIVSCNNGFTNKYANAAKRLARIKADICKNTDVGVLYVDLMLHDAYGTPRGEVRVKYVGDESETVVHKGGIKHSLVGFESGGCYNFRYAVENREIEYAVFGIYGEGALYPLHFRYTRNGKKYVAATVEVLCGQVTDAEKVLYNDTRFASMGCDDGIAHFNDLSVSKQRHEIKITFKPLA